MNEMDFGKMTNNIVEKIGDLYLKIQREMLFDDIIAVYEGEYEDYEDYRSKKDKQLEQVNQAHIESDKIEIKPRPIELTCEQFVYIAMKGAEKRGK